MTQLLGSYFVTLLNSKDYP